MKDELLDGDWDQARVYAARAFYTLTIYFKHNSLLKILVRHTLEYQVGAPDVMLRMQISTIGSSTAGNRISLEGDD